MLLSDFALGAGDYGLGGDECPSLSFCGARERWDKGWGRGRLNQEWGQGMSKHRKSSPKIDRSRIALPYPPRAMSYHMWSCASTFVPWRRSHDLVVWLNFLSPYKDMSRSTWNSNTNGVSPVPWPQPMMYTLPPSARLVPTPQRPLFSCCLCFPH